MGAFDDRSYPDSEILGLIAGHRTSSEGGGYRFNVVGKVVGSVVGCLRAAPGAGTSYTERPAGGRPKQGS